ncbi:unknow [Vibrio campbellii]|nr:unknow [Vibrio campbellii]
MKKEPLGSFLFIGRKCSRFSLLASRFSLRYNHKLLIG